MVSAALEQLLIMHADHEQNLSTATVRNAGSQANLYACISAGMSALWGPLTAGQRVGDQDPGADRGGWR